MVKKILAALLLAYRLLPLPLWLRRLILWLPHHHGYGHHYHHHHYYR